MGVTGSLDILRDADYRRLLLIVASTTLGEFLLESIVYAWIIASTNADGIRPVLIGLYVLLSTLPRIVAGVLVGVVADNSGAKRSIVVANCGRASAALVLGIGIIPAYDRVAAGAAVLLILVTVCSTLNQLFLAARAKYVQQIIAPPLRPAAASTSMTVLTALSIGSAAAGPSVFVQVGLVPSLALIMAMFAIGALLSLSIRSTGPDMTTNPSRQRKVNFFRALITGWRVCWEVSALRAVLLGAVFYGIPMGINNVALILLWVETKGGTISQYGLASALFGLGALCGSLLAPKLIVRWRMVRIYVFSLSMLGVSYVALAITPDLIASFALMGISGGIFSIFAVVQSPMVLNSAPTEMTGRIASTTNSASALSALVSSMLASAFFAIPGSGSVIVPSAVALGGLSTIIGGALLASGHRREAGLDKKVSAASPDK
ncbi:MFS transporter [Arthrobacter sp. NPDC090010]|uniref:MFS transporter n=1 Tax=Arthrobacter sp. NPDC090010 TaxID=3363942 RepID=UPI0038275B5B